MGVEMKKSKIEEQIVHFNNISAIYYDSKQGERYFLLKKSILDAANFHIQEGAVIPDAMCRDCDLYELIKARVGKSFKYDAFDYSKQMIEFAKKKLSDKAGGDINIWIQDIIQFQCSLKYDYIFVIGGLHHIYHYKEIGISNLIAALNKEDRIIISEPVYGNWIFKKLSEFI
jgi:SAM-dependent methyltransferase